MAIIGNIPYFQTNPKWLKSQSNTDPLSTEDPPPLWRTIPTTPATAGSHREGNLWGMRGNNACAVGSALQKVKIAMQNPQVAWKNHATTPWFSIQSVIGLGKLFAPFRKIAAVVVASKQDSSTKTQICQQDATSNPSLIDKQQREDQSYCFPMVTWERNAVAALQAPPLAQN